MDIGSQRTHPSKNAAQNLPNARLAATVLAAFRAGWDRLGLVIAVSLSWAFVLSLPLSLERFLPPAAGPMVRLLALAMIPVVMALPTAGAFAIAHRIAAHEEAAYSHLWTDGAALFRSAIGLILLQTGLASALVLAAGFYLGLPFWFGRIGVTICGYALLLWTMMAVYQWPVLVAQEKGLFDADGRAARRGAMAAVRRSFYLALGRPFFAVALVAVSLVLAVLLAAAIILPALLGIGTLSLISTYATRALLMQYGVVPAPKPVESVPDDQFRLNLGRSDLKTDEQSHSP